MKPRMSKRMVALLSTVAVVVIVGFVALGLSTVRQSPTPAGTALGDPAASAAPGAPKVTDGGGVQVQVTFDPQTGAQDNRGLFQVTMTTHSVELAQFDLATLSKIVLDSGAMLTAFTWQPKGEGVGHHVEGTLTALDPEGLLAKARTITLEITDLAADEPRRYEWTGSAR